MKSICEFDEDGTKRWYNEHKELHREDGPALEWNNGDKEWWINGDLHREDAPAVEYANGIKKWYINHKLHREDGPAIELSNGRQFWYYHGKKINVLSQEEFKHWLKLKMFW